MRIRLKQHQLAQSSQERLISIKITDHCVVCKILASILVLESLKRARKAEARAHALNMVRDSVLWTRRISAGYKKLAASASW